MTTGRDKIEAALSADGTREIPVVICYEDIFIRDHWRELTSCPWWYRFAPDVERQMAWRRDAIAAIGQDWIDLPSFYSRAERASFSIEVRGEDVLRIDRRTGRAGHLTESPVGGAHIDLHAAVLVTSVEALDELIPGPADDHAPKNDGRGDLAAALLREVGDELFPMSGIGTPFESCVLQLWGFEQTMRTVAEAPDLVAHACERFLAYSLNAVREAARLGAAGVFIEDIFADIISPRAFATLVLPFSRRIVEEVRTLGMKSVYYFCGNPAGKWGLLFDIGADALSLEESKKGFVIDIEDVVDRVGRRCAVLGNLDAIGVLQDGTDAQLRAEIARQIAAGRRNGGQFIMSLGSPVTPRTPVERVRLYCELAHELGT